MKNSKALIKSIVGGMTIEELRAELIALAGASKRSAEDFILRHSKSESDVLLEMVRGKAEEIAKAIRKNTADEETAWRVAERRAGRRVYHEGGSFAVAIKDELKEAERYTAELSKKGRGGLALEFARSAAALIPAAIKASPCGVEWVFDARDLWKIILNEARGAARKEAFEGMLQEVEAEVDPGLDLWFLSTSHPDPEFVPRVIALLDQEIGQMKKTEDDFCRRGDEPMELRLRLVLMRGSGMKEDEIEDYLVAHFSDCDFTQELLFKRAEARGDAKAAAVICRRLLGLRLSVEKRREYSEKLSQFQLATGDAAGRIATLRDAALKGAADLEDLRRLRALLPAAEWEAMLSGFLEDVSKDACPSPRFFHCCELLKDVGDLDRLWGLVKKSQRRSVWLSFSDVLAPLHADAYGDFLLEHLDREPKPGSLYLDFGTEPVSEIYARWAKVIKRASEIPGQREKAFRKAEKLAAANPRAWSMKAAWEKAGLPGFKTAAEKRARTARAKKN